MCAILKFRRQKEILTHTTYVLRKRNANHEKVYVSRMPFFRRFELNDLEIGTVIATDGLN